MRLFFLAQFIISLLRFCFPNSIPKSPDLFIPSTESVNKEHPKINFVELINILQLRKREKKKKSFGIQNCNSFHSLLLVKFIMKLDDNYETLKILRVMKESSNLKILFVDTP